MPEVKQVTTLAELIKRFEKRKDEAKTFTEAVFCDAVISEATELLTKERQDLIDCYAYGYNNALDPNKSNITPDTYVTSTFE